MKSSHTDHIAKQTMSTEDIKTFNRVFNIILNEIYNVDTFDKQRVKIEELYDLIKDNDDLISSMDEESFYDQLHRCFLTMYENGVDVIDEYYHFFFNEEFPHEEYEDSLEIAYTLPVNSSSPHTAPAA